MHLVKVRVAAEVEQAAAAVGVEIVVSRLPVAGVGVIETEPVAVLRGQRRMGDDLVQHADHRGRVEQHLGGAAVVVPFFRRQRPGLVEELHLVGADPLELRGVQQSRQGNPPLQIEQVLLFVAHRYHRHAVGVGRRQ